MSTVSKVMSIGCIASDSAVNSWTTCTWGKAQYLDSNSSPVTRYSGTCSCNGFHLLSSFTSPATLWHLKTRKQVIPIAEVHYLLKCPNIESPLYSTTYLFLNIVIVKVIKVRRKRESYCHFASSLTPKQAFDNSSPGHDRWVLLENIRKCLKSHIYANGMLGLVG